MKKIIILIITVVFFAVVVFAGGIHFGMISAVKSQVIELDKKKMRATINRSIERSNKMIYYLIIVYPVQSKNRLSILTL